MNSIIPAPQVSLEVSRALSKGAASRASSTQRLYREAQARFKEWATARALPVLPTTPRTLVTYLSELQERGLSVSSLRLAKGAIFAAHKAADYPDPVPMGSLGEALQGIIRSARRAHPVTKAHAVTSSEVRTMCRQTDVARDRAIMCLGFVTALRRSEIGALDLEDLDFHEQGCTVTIQRSKTSDVAQLVRFELGEAARVLGEWIEERGCKPGPLFPSRNKGKHLSGRRVADILKENAARASIEGVTGHSLRRGYVTEAMGNGATLPQVQAVTRHKSAATLLGYAEATGPLPKVGL